MARPRKPTAVLEMSGAFSKNPKRRAAREHEPTDPGVLAPPPEYFDDHHRAVWFEFIEQAAPGVLTRSDHTLLELVTRLTCKMRHLPGTTSPLLRFLMDLAQAQGMPADKLAALERDTRKLLYCSAQEVSLLSSLLTRMGMTPADRSRVSPVTPKRPNDEWDEFDAIPAKSRR